MSEEQGNGVDLDLNVGGQQIKMKNVKSFNTIVTVLTLMVVCTGGVFIWTAIDAHSAQTKEASTAFVKALQEQTVVMREQVQVQREGNCLQTYQGPVNSKAEFCRNISR